jgi:hypothetical protein
MQLVVVMAVRKAVVTTYLAPFLHCQPCFKNF